MCKLRVVLLPVVPGAAKVVRLRFKAGLQYFSPCALMPWPSLTVSDPIPAQRRAISQRQRVNLLISAALP